MKTLGCGQVGLQGILLGERTLVVKRMMYTETLNGKDSVVFREGKKLGGVCLSGKVSNTITGRISNG